MSSENYFIKLMPKLFVVVFLCPAITKDDLTVTFSPKSGTLDIVGKPAKNVADSLPDFELGMTETIKVPEKYNSKSVKLTVVDGVGTIEIEISPDVIVA